MTSQYCQGSAPNNIAGSSLSCYSGYVQSIGGGPGVYPASSDARSSSFSYCVDVTVKCPVPSNPDMCVNVSSGTSVRYYGGMSIATFNGEGGVRMYGLNPGVYSDVLICSTSNCNAPLGGVSTLARDPCGMGQGVGVSYLSCSSPGLPPFPATYDLSCYTSAPPSPPGVGVPPTLSPIIPGARYCTTSSIVCLGIDVSDSNSACYGMTVGSVVRRYGVAPASIYAALPALLPYPSPLRLGLGAEVHACNSPGCNAPSSDPCPLASSPIATSLQLSGFNAGAAAALSSGNFGGGLSLSLSNTLATLGGCATCTGVITSASSISPPSTAATSSSSSQGGTATLSFSISGASAQSLANSLAATTTPAFAAALAGALNAMAWGGGGIVVTPILPSPSTTSDNTMAIALGVGVGLGGVLLALCAWCMWSARSSKAALAVDKALEDMNCMSPSEDTALSPLATGKGGGRGMRGGATGGVGGAPALTPVPAAKRVEYMGSPDAVQLRFTSPGGVGSPDAYASPGVGASPSSEVSLGAYSSQFSNEGSPKFDSPSSAAAYEKSP
jgi:hypothetical protein